MPLDTAPDAPEEHPPEAPRVPIYATGPPLRIDPESVQLTFLTLAGADRLVEPEETEEEEHPGLEIRTPLGVKIPAFEGPLDLLLYLIRRDKVDIYDIPIGEITERYLGMLGLMQILDLEVAGEFLVMAATLMRVKARMLLPSWPDDEEDEEDPRADLVRQLLEYRQFKEAARSFKSREETRRQQFQRGFMPRFEDDSPPALAPISHFALIEVMKEVLARVGEEFFYEVELEDVTLEEKMELVTAELEEKGRILFVDLLARTPRRIHVVVTFMAILELARLNRIAIAQEGAFAEIWVYPFVSAEETPAAVEPAATGDTVAEEPGPIVRPSGKEREDFDGTK